MLWRLCRARHKRHTYATLLLERRAPITYVAAQLGHARPTTTLPGVTRADVTRLHLSLRKTPYQANRVLALVSKMMNLAEKWGLRPDGSNPCRHVERFKEHTRERFLSSAELAKLGEALAVVELENVELPSVAPAIRLLLFTGARLSEILTLRWEYLALEGGVVRLPDSKTGAKVIHLNPGARRVLAPLPREKDNPWVIRGRFKGTRLVNLEDPWQRIRQQPESMTFGFTISGIPSRAKVPRSARVSS